MSEECSVLPCRKHLPASSVVSILCNTQESNSTCSKDCSTNLLYLVDEQGFLNISDPADTTPYLTPDNRSVCITDISQITQFYTKCSRIYFELSRLFSKNAADLVRPSSVTLLYWDSTSEQMIDVIQDYYSCNTCYYALTHVAYDRAGTPLFDDGNNTAAIAAMQLPISAWAMDTLVQPFFPITTDELFNYSETVSVAHQAKALGYCNTTFVMLNVECPYVLDEFCEPTDVTAVTAGMQHLLAAGVATSRSSSTSPYVYNFKYKPKGGITFEGISPANITPTEFYNIVGTAPTLGGVQAVAGHHVNAYISIDGNYRVFADGVSATGVPIDHLFYRRYIHDSMTDSIMTLLMESDVVSLTDLSGLKNELTSLVRQFINQGIIDNTSGALNKDQFNANDIYAQGEGWVVLETDSCGDGQRVTPTFMLCYQEPDAIDYVSLAICNGC